MDQQFPIGPPVMPHRKNAAEWVMWLALMLGNFARNVMFRPALIVTSLALAAAAEGLFIADQVLHRPAEPMLFILTLGWPVYYSIVMGFAFAMASIVARKGITGWPAMIERQFPSLPVEKMFNAWITLGARMALIVFPIAASLIGVVVLCSEFASRH